MVVVAAMRPQPLPLLPLQALPLRVPLALLEVEVVASLPQLLASVPAPPQPQPPPPLPIVFSLRCALALKTQLKKESPSLPHRFTFLCGVNFPPFLKAPYLPPC